MATTAKELIEILQKYVDPDEVVIWQYYTRADFDYDDDVMVTNKQFARSLTVSEAGTSGKVCQIRSTTQSMTTKRRKDKNNATR